MKRVYVNEEWCLGCHLCEYQCAFANSGEADMFKAFNKKETPLFRDIPCNKDIYRSYWYIKNYRLGKKDTDILGQYYLNGLTKEKLKLVKT